MTITDRPKTALPDLSPTLDLVAPAREGVLSAVASSFVAIAVAGVVWLTSGDPVSTWANASAVGAAWWLLVHGVGLSFHGAPVTVVPLLATAGVLWWSAGSARRTLVATAPAGRFASAGMWATGYATVMAAMALVTLLGPVRPEPWRLIAALIAFPLTALSMSCLDPQARLPLTWPKGLPRLPGWMVNSVRRGASPAVKGVALTLASGGIIVLGQVLYHWSTVVNLQGELGAGLIGGTLLVVAQVLALPNLALWATSFVAGTGFQIAGGGEVTWTAANSGLLPMIPVFGAAPQTGPLPEWVAASVAIPVVVGLVMGLLVVQSLARLSGWFPRIAGVVAASGMAAAALGVIDAIGGGALGKSQLHDLGAPAAAMAGTLALEFLAGGLLALILSALWRASGLAAIRLPGQRGRG